MKTDARTEVITLGMISDRKERLAVGEREGDVQQADYRDRTKRTRQEPRPVSSRREQDEQPVPVAGKGTASGDRRRSPRPVRTAGAVAQGTHVGRDQSDGGCVAVRGRCQPRVDDATPAERAQVYVRSHGLH